MTTVNAEVNAKVKELPMSGTIVFVKDEYSEPDSVFGVVASEEFFLSNARGGMLNEFTDYPRDSPNQRPVPVLIMNNQFHWGLRFRQVDHIVPFDFSLLSEENVFWKNYNLFRCFCKRDGSRYYREYSADLAKFHRHILDGRNFKTDRFLSHMEKKFIQHLIEWRDKQCEGFFVCSPS